MNSRSKSGEVGEVQEDSFRCQARPFPLLLEGGMEKTR